ncbi:uncharacterized protein LOC141708615 [Apium graveolens]|uniref:uncharacterized protein LOC141708615 n=1 Tax=Apium graveolens TaxID=4045 RepID=UPI003D7B4288
MIDELDNLSPIPKCVCTSTTCACGNAQKLFEYEKLTKLSQFLMGLSEQFIFVRGQILLMNPLLDISQAYSILFQEENQRDYSSNVIVVPENIAMNAKMHNSFKAKQVKKFTDSSVMCDYCKMQGHMKDKCFTLHGYPDWHRLYGQPKPKVKSAQRKFNANAVTTTDVEQSEIFAITGTNKESTSMFTESQYQQLLNLLQQTQGKTPAISNATWMNTAKSETNCADSGATYHITPHKNLLVNIQHVESELLLPNGHIACVTQTGHDLTVQKKTEIGELDAGLYKLHTNHLIPSANMCSVSSNQWHIRLWHPSLSVLKNISELGVHDNADCCDYDSAEVEHKTLLIPKLHTARPTEMALYVASENGEGRILHASTISMVEFQASRIDGSCHGLLYFAETYTNPLRSQFRILPPVE